MVRAQRDCRGPRAWHVVREALGTWEALPPPSVSFEGRIVQPQEGYLMGHEVKGVRSSHSTLRR